MTPSRRAMPPRTFGVRVEQDDEEEMFMATRQVVMEEGEDEQEGVAPRGELEMADMNQNFPPPRERKFAPDGRRWPRAVSDLAQLLVALRYRRISMGPNFSVSGVQLASALCCFLCTLIVLALTAGASHGASGAVVAAVNTTASG